MEPIRVIEGTALPIDRSDVDTDQIIPAEYLKRIERTGFGPFLFAEWRKDPDFVINDPRYAGASILLAGRELRLRVQPRARAVGDRGRGVPRHDRAELRRHLPQQLHEDRAAAGRAATGVGARVDGRGARRPDHADRRRPGAPRRSRAPDLDESFDIEDFTRWRLLEGLDDIGLTMRKQEEIAAYESQRPSWLPTA